VDGRTSAALLESPQSLLLKKREGEIEKKKNKGHPPLVCF